MGIFSSKKTTTAYIATQRMLDGVAFHSSSDYAMQDALFGKSRLDYANAVMQYQNNSLPKKFARMQKMAKTKSKYVFGTPTSSKLTDKKKALDDLLLTYLTDVENKQVTLLYSLIGDKDFNHYAWLKLINQYGYNGKTNELTVLSKQKGTPCYLYTGKIIYSKRSDSEYELIRINYGNILGFDYGQCFNRLIDMRKKAVYEVGETDQFVFTYQYKGASGAITETVTIGMSEINPPDTNTYTAEPDFIQACYRVNDETKFYTYEYLSGQNLALDNNVDFDDGLGTYYPRLYLRTDGKDIIDSKDELYVKHTKNFCKSIGINLADITKKVSKGIGDNLSISKDIYISLVARPNVDTENQVVAKYLFNFFTDLYKTTVQQYGDAKSKPIILDVADNISSQYVLCNGITYSVNTGIAINAKNEPLKQGQYCILREFTKDKSSIFKSGWNHRFIYQLTDSKYMEVTVNNLQSKASVKGHLAIVSSDHDELFIPLDIKLVNYLPQKEKELLFHKCLHIQITLLKVTKESWWQTGIFKAIMVVVGIVIAVATAGAGASITTVLINMAVNTAVSFAIGYALNIVIRLAMKLGLNAEVAAALATLIEIGIAVYSKGKSFGKFLKADTLMQQLNIAYGNYQRSINFKLEKLQSDYSKLSKYYSDKEKQLTEIKNALLSSTIPLALDTLLEKENTRIYNEVNLGETPEEFYNRTMFYDITNVDIEYIKHFADMTTQLPSFKEIYNNYKQRQEELDIHSGLLV